jgi:hypothetical protein
MYIYTELYRLCIYIYILVATTNPPLPGAMNVVRFLLVRRLVSGFQHVHCHPFKTERRSPTTQKHSSRDHPWISLAPSVHLSCKPMLCGYMCITFVHVCQVSPHNPRRWWKPVSGTWWPRWGFVWQCGAGGWCGRWQLSWRKKITFHENLGAPFGILDCPYRPWGKLRFLLKLEIVLAFVLDMRHGFFKDCTIPNVWRSASTINMGWAALQISQWGPGSGDRLESKRLLPRLGLKLQHSPLKQTYVVPALHGTTRINHGIKPLIDRISPISLRSVMLSVFLLVRILSADPLNITVFCQIKTRPNRWNPSINPLENQRL